MITHRTYNLQIVDWLPIKRQKENIASFFGDRLMSISVTKDRKHITFTVRV